MFILFEVSLFKLALLPQAFLFFCCPRAGFNRKWGRLYVVLTSLFNMKALNRTGNRKTINVNPGLSRNRFVPKPVYPKTGLQNGSETGLENGS